MKASDYENINKSEIKELNCKRCGYRWKPRKERIFVCPKCNSAYWNVEKKGEIGNEKDKRI